MSVETPAFRLLADVEPNDHIGDDWGPWRLNPEARVLHTVEPYRYEIDLDTCTTSAEVLDWICQAAGKTWADDATVAGLIRALDDVLKPQAHLCSSGRSKRLSRRCITALVREAAQRFGERAHA
jgi:hypothetical protein